MRPLVFVVLVALAVVLVWMISEAAEESVEHEGVQVVAQWGTERPPYVVDAQMFTTTTTARARTAPTRPKVRTASAGPVVLEENVNGYPCGGVELPPCFVMRRESGGNPNAYNARGCNGHGCFGLWQFSGEWACHFGLSCDIAHWTPEEQTHAARTLWDGGRGHAHWGI